MKPRGLLIFLLVAPVLGGVACQIGPPVGEPPDAGSKCAPKTCADLARDCGQLSDTCGALINCGQCQSPLSCGGGGTPNVCGQGVCTPKTDAALCSSLGKNCGSITAADNCGTLRTVGCGTCSAPESCGGGGIANVCGKTSNCTPETDSTFCLRIGTNCGIVTATDNCGVSRTAACGTCTSPEFCGALTPNVCGCTGNCGGIDAGPGPDAGGLPADSGTAGCSLDTQCQSQFGAGYWCDPRTQACVWGCLAPPTCGAFCCSAGACDTATHQCVGPDAGLVPDGGIVFGDGGIILCNPAALTNCGCPAGTQCYSTAGAMCTLLGICF